MICVDFRCNRLYAIKSEMRRVDRHKLKGDLPTGRLRCSLDGGQINYTKRRWLLSHMKVCHEIFRIKRKMTKKDKSGETPT